MEIDPILRRLAELKSFSVKNTGFMQKLFKYRG